jgi:hypothetical protein
VPDGKDRDQQMSGQQQSRLPVPDPTTLTTELTHREIAHLKELHGELIDALEERLDAYEQAHETKHRERAAEVEKEVQHFVELAAERFAGVADRFAGIQLQLTERDSRVAESSQASKDAIAAALAAQKEAVGKSEQATKEQLASLKSELGESIASLRTQLDDMKNLTGHAAGRGVGLDTALSRTFTLAAVVIAAISVAVAIVLGTR